MAARHCYVPPRSKGPSSDEVGAKRGSWEETVRLLVDAGADLTALDQRDLDWCPYVFDDEAVFPDTPLGHVSSLGQRRLGEVSGGQGSRHTSTMLIPG